MPNAAQNAAATRQDAGLPKRLTRYVRIRANCATTTLARSAPSVLPIRASNPRDTQAASRTPAESPTGAPKISDAAHAVTTLAITAPKSEGRR